MVAYDEMKAHELVQAYNSLAAQLGVPEVSSRFSSKALGIKKCQALEELLQQANGQADEEPAQDEPAQEEPAQEEPAREEPAQEEDGPDLSNLTPQEAKAQLEAFYNRGKEVEPQKDVEEDKTKLHAFFGDPDLPSPEEQKKVKAEAKPKAPKAQPEPPAERIQVDVSDPEAVFKAFKVREGTNKHRLLTAMIFAMGQSLPLNAMLKAAYGKEGVGDEGSLMMIVKGITVAISKNGLPFEVKKTRVAKVLHLALVHLEPEPEQAPEAPEEQA